MTARPAVKAEAPGVDACPVEEQARREPLSAVVVVASVLLAAGVAVPSARPLVPLLTAWSSAVLVGLVLVGAPSRARRRPWWVLAAPAGALAGAWTLPHAPEAVGPDMAALALLQVATAALLGPVLWRARARILRRTRSRAALRLAVPRLPWLDLGVVLIGTATAVWHVAVLGARSPVLLQQPGVAVPVAFDVALLGLLVWTASTRTGGPPSTRLVLLSAAGVTTARLLVILDPSGQPPEGAATALGAGAGALLGLAALDPARASVARAWPAAAFRSPSGRVLAVLPFALLPATVSLAGVGYADPVLPPWLAPVAMMAVTVLALLRSVDLVRGIERQAERDPLTDQLNRRGLLRRVQQLQADDQPTLTAVVDVDGFKQVNDRLGHEAGDALLVAVAGRLRAAVGEHGVVARPGGDEFVVLFTGASGRDAVDQADLADRLLDGLQAPVDVGGRTLRVAASIGVARLDPGSRPEDALVDADVAMYAAKRRGGDRLVHYQAALREEVLGHAVLQQELRRLLVRSPDDPGVDGALVVHYQPVVGLATGRPIAVEALVRWQHPRRGLIGPDTFVPLAEAAGLGATLDAAVLHQALHQVAAWDAAGVTGLHRVGVNLGVGSLRSTALRRTVHEAARAAGVGLDRLVLEITEHDALPVGTGVEQVLQALREEGATVAIDDFGAGYSALATLRAYPVDALKIDRTLLPQAGDPPPVAGAVDAHVLLRGVVGLAASLRLETVAEGIETEQDRDLVERLGAANGQGYLFSRPLPADELAAWWRARTAPGVPTPRGVPS